MEDKTRRDVLRDGWKIGGALLVGAAGYTAYEALRPLTGGDGGGPIEVGNPADFAEGTATYFPEGRLYVVNAQDQYFALSQKCPHLGCKVPFCESSGRFECPCHASIFDVGGEYITGPSPRGLDRYELALTDDTLVVDTSVLKAGPDRGADEFLTPPKGPNCAEEG
ncbi:MAG TPA: Rieske 2Fe-2S domain-containing protein [Acidimicrobiia bacterium]|nr:Rieske 2Fe-2S domain-containing protein [Acidimicrobiia bacterium]